MPIIAAAETARPQRYDLSVNPRYAAFAGDLLGQQYSLLGREDLTAQTDPEYSAKPCPALVPLVEGQSAILDEIVRRAASTRIVIVNESHVVTRHRGFSMAIAQRLRPLGYTHFAAETFSHAPEGPSAVDDAPDYSYPREFEGTYLEEAAFGRLWREAKALGYIGVAYEENTPDVPGATIDERIAKRESFQAAALAEELKAAGPDAKFLIHVGYGHAREVGVPQDDGSVEKWMAARLREATGIDPLTIFQTACSSDRSNSRLAGAPIDLPLGTADLFVEHPVTTFTNHRPDWREMIGDLRTSIPLSLKPGIESYVIEARLSGEPEEAVPMDRVLVRAGEDVDLLLPPGHYQLRAVRVIDGARAKP
jgi:hypothetical protein